MKRLSLIAFLVFVALTRQGEASIPPTKVSEEMNKFLSPFLKKEGWTEFLKTHSARNQSQPFVSAEEISFQIAGEKVNVGLGFRSVYISAAPKTVVSVIDSPQFFQALYGLDKPANISSPKPDGSYEARIFKIVPGLETQDFTLDYHGRWIGGTWIGQAKMIRDEKNFALRNNIKLIEPQGDGAIYREIALFYPLRWWLKLFHGTVQSVTKNEMAKLNKTIKCASEKVQDGVPMSDEIGKTCFAEASK